MSEPPPSGFAGWLHAAKGLTVVNAVVVFVLVLAMVPAYFLYKLLGDPLLLDRFMSSYSETPTDVGCTIRKARQRGAPWQYSVSQGFAFSGSDRWSVAVVLDHEPKPDEVVAYCATSGLLIEKMSQ